MRQGFSPAGTVQSMKDKLLPLYQKYQTFILYALYGVPPTIVNFGGYLLMINLFGFSAAVSTAIAWCVAVVISFSLYRRFVFWREHKNRMGGKGLALAFFKFVSLRIVSGLMETGFVWLFVDLMGLHKLLFKVLASFAAALINYTVCRLFIFTGKNKT